MKLLGRWILCAAFLASGTAAGDDTFKSVTVGFEVSKPASWQFVTAEQNLENLRNTKLNDEQEIWIVPRGDYFFLIGAGTRQDEKTGSRQEIRRILDTVKVRQ